MGSESKSSKVCRMFKANLECKSIVKVTDDHVSAEKFCAPQEGSWPVSVWLLGTGLLAQRLGTNGKSTLSQNKVQPNFNGNGPTGNIIHSRSTILHLVYIFLLCSYLERIFLYSPSHFPNPFMKQNQCLTSNPHSSATCTCDPPAAAHDVPADPHGVGPRTGETAWILCEE